jgi:hypothetical protein
LDVQNILKHYKQLYPSFCEEAIIKMATVNVIHKQEKKINIEATEFDNESIMKYPYVKTWIKRIAGSPLETQEDRKFLH